MFRPALGADAERDRIIGFGDGFLADVAVNVLGLRTVADAAALTDGEELGEREPRRLDPIVQRHNIGDNYERAMRGEILNPRRERVGHQVGSAAND